MNAWLNASTAPAEVAARGERRPPATAPEASVPRTAGPAIEPVAARAHPSHGGVERGWFRRRVAGEDTGFLYSSEADPDGELDHVDAADAEQNIAAYRREIELTRQAAAARELDETFFQAD